MEHIVQQKSFKEVREFASSLNLKSKKEWDDYCKSGQKPQFIPDDVFSSYKEYGWKGWSDFIGLDEIIPLTYEETSSIIQSLNIRTVKEFSEYMELEGKKLGMPKNPKYFYKGKGWIDWETFFNKKEQIGYRNFMSFEEAKKFTSNLNIKTQKEWKRYCKSGQKPNNIPNCPEQTYKPYGWKGWSDFLGKGDKQMTYQELKSFIQPLKLKSKKEYGKYVLSNKLTNSCTRFPDVSFRDKGWESWWDFLGKGISIDKIRYFLSYEEAQKFVQGIGIKTYYDWLEYVKSGYMNNRIPKHPHKYYVGKGWTNWKEFLGRNINGYKKFQPFEKAKEYVKTLGLANSLEWRMFLKSGDKPNDIPSSPNYVYRNNGWDGWYDFLNANSKRSILSNKSNVPMKSFEEAKKIVQEVGIRTSIEWIFLCKNGNTPEGIPKNLSIAYKGNGWNGFKDFLGRVGGYKKFKEFGEARAFVRNLNLKSQTDWNLYLKYGEKPNDIPASPALSYKGKGWISWNDFLGK